MTSWEMRWEGGDKAAGGAQEAGWRWKNPIPKARGRETNGKNTQELPAPNFLLILSNDPATL